jgi:hypothetical protein
MREPSLWPNILVGQGYISSTLPLKHPLMVKLVKQEVKASGPL